MCHRRAKVPTFMRSFQQLGAHDQKLKAFLVYMPSHATPLYLTHWMLSGFADVWMAYGTCFKSSLFGIIAHRDCFKSPLFAIICHQDFIKMTPACHKFLRGQSLARLLLPHSAPAWFSAQLTREGAAQASVSFPARATLQLYILNVDGAVSIHS